MRRDDERAEQPSPRFGPVDPFCWLPVAALLVLAVLMALGGVLTAGLIIGLIAVAIVVFDARVNRPDAQPPRRPAARRPVPTSRRTDRW